MKFCFFHAYKMLTPMSHKIFNSSIRDWRYTSKLLPSDLGPRITRLRNIYSLSKHILGVRLYGVTKTSQQRYGGVLGEAPNGQKLFVESTSLTFRESCANICVWLKCFQASGSAGCVITDSSWCTTFTC